MLCPALVLGNDATYRPNVFEFRKVHGKALALWPLTKP